MRNLKPNRVKPAWKKWVWLFAGREYEDMDIIEMNLYTKVYDHQLKELDDRTKRQLFRNWERYIYPIGDAKYINHGKFPNSHIQIDKDKIIVISDMTIHEGEEILIDYWENNIDFDVL